MSSKAMSLKARLRNMAREKGVMAQVLLQNYMFERFLVRLAQSDYRDKFVLKGGMLIAAMVGLEQRSTMDLDTTVRNLPMTEQSILEAINAICAVAIADGSAFEVNSTSLIRADDEYGGYRVALTARYDTIAVPLSIDISTGDVVTPMPVKISLKGMFDDLQLDLWAYNIETVLAEKIETILRRNIFSTRPRDFYDVYILGTTQPYDKALLREAIAATAAHRGTTEQIADVPALLQAIAESQDLQEMWAKYQKQFGYAASISYEQIMGTLSELIQN